MVTKAEEFIKNIPEFDPNVFFQQLCLISSDRHQNYLSYVGKIEEVKIKSSSLVHRICFWEVVSSNVIKGATRILVKK